jgi:hypothetical protein
MAFMARPRALLFSSMPCTGGSTWNFLNVKKPGGAARRRKHIRLFNKLWSNFDTIARQAYMNKNYVAIEWPENCTYWKLPKVQKLIKEIGLDSVSFDGCMLGLTSIVDGKPIKKPWKIYTNSEEIIKQFQGLRCNGHPEHRPCAGVDTKITENYTPEFIDRLHAGWGKQCSKKN